MLDQLEAEVVELRSRNRELERVAANSVQPQGRSTKRRVTVRRKKSSTRGKSVKNPKRAPTQQETVGPRVVQPGAPADKPMIGKRQALGRSIIQLRRLATAATTEH